MLSPMELTGRAKRTALIADEITGRARSPVLQFEAPRFAARPWAALAACAVFACAGSARADCSAADLAGVYSVAAQLTLPDKRCSASGEMLFDGRGTGHYRGRVTCTGLRKTMAYLLRYFVRPDCRGAMTLADGSLQELQVDSPRSIRFTERLGTTTVHFTGRRERDANEDDTAYGQALQHKGGAVEKDGHLNWIVLIAAAGPGAPGPVAPADNRSGTIADTLAWGQP